MRVATLVDRSAALQIVVAFGLCTYGGVVVADDEEMPEIDFLEYLGSWEESDEDWLILRDVEAIRGEVAIEERNDPVPAGEESAENVDED